MTVYTCGTSYFTLMEEQRCGVLHNMLLRGIFGSKWTEGTGHLGKLAS
jgi:hypothetical protein